MTTPRTIPQLTDVVEYVGIFGFLVLTWFEVIRMTCCTIRLIGRRRPCHYLAVGFMAGDTEKIAAVVSRICR